MSYIIGELNGHQFVVPTSGGKAGFGHCVTSNIQIRKGNRIVKQIKFVVADEGSRKRAIQRAKIWVVDPTANLRTGVLPKHGHASGKKSAIYKRWEGIRRRCRSKIPHVFKVYGARGITVCDEWANSFEAFLAWATTSGFSPELEIDRIDNDKGYCPENCRWVTQVQQNANRRCSIIFPTGETTGQVAKRLGMSVRSFTSRLRNGWSMERAINTPKRVPKQ